MLGTSSLSCSRFIGGLVSLYPAMTKFCLKLSEKSPNLGPSSAVDLLHTIRQNAFSA